MSNEEVTFQRGETVPIYLDVDLMSTGVAIDPTTITVDVYRPDETKIVDGQDMTKLEVGKYVYYHNTQLTDPIGWYRTVCIGVDGSGGGAKTTIEDGGFELE